MSTETYIFKDHFKPIFDDHVVLKQIFLHWKVTSCICVKSKVKVEFSRADNFI
jgi:hypothetical protein